VLNRFDDVDLAMESVSEEADCHPRAIGRLAIYPSKNKDSDEWPVMMSGLYRPSQVCKPEHIPPVHYFL
jgi:hypothetical protein